MLSHLERPAGPAPSLSQVWADFNLRHAANGLIGWIFAATGPVAIVLSAGTQGHLTEPQMASWIFGMFFINGLLGALLCWRYRQPMVLFWTIPGAVLVGQSLSHLSFAEVVGAYYATGLLMLLLGASGWVRRAMQSVPMPIVMGMVAGVFLRFGLDLVRAVHTDLAIAGPMVAVWLLLSVSPGLGRRMPPMIGALLVGAIAIALLGRFDVSALAGLGFVQPIVPTPEWSWAAMVELVVPLAITVLVVQNGQGFAVLRAAGHDTPIDVVTVACGIGSIASAVVGSVSTCLTGPTNAIVTSSGEKSGHYTAGIFVGTLAVLFSVIAPVFTRLMLNAPRSFIMALAGLAMLRVLQAAFTTSFGGRFTLGALVAFLVTVADQPILNIGAAFWGLIAGIAMSLMLERKDFEVLGSAR